MSKPTVNSAQITAISNPPNRKLVKLPVVSTTDIILGILQDVGKMGGHIPYLEGIAGILRSVIKIRQEMKETEESCQELIDDVLELSSDLLSKLKQLSESEGKNKLEAIRKDLEEYHHLLEELQDNIGGFLQGYQSQNRLVKWMHRNPKISKALEKRVAKFKEKYQSNIIFHLVLLVGDPQNSNTLITTSVSPPSWSKVPKPSKMVGREKELENMLAHMRTNIPPRIAILGPGGMGKTTLALHFLCTKEVINTYPSRFFASCEGRFSVNELLLDIAEKIQMPSERRKDYLQQRILEHLEQHQTIICLDNLETLWEPSELRKSTEEFLNALSNIDTLGLLITMRGNQHPGSVDWLPPLLEPLSSLKKSHSLQVFEQIVYKPACDTIETLLQEMDGIPLAITLVSHLIRDGTESPESLWSQWKHEKTTSLQTGDQRTSSLNISIMLSINSARMTDSARSLLQLLSFLPDGLFGSHEMLEMITSYMPQFQAALAVLKSVALVQQFPKGQIYILSPIKQFCLKENTPLIYGSEALNFYINLLKKYDEPSVPEKHKFIPEEFNNVSHILLNAYDDGEAETEAVEAAIIWTKWSCYLGKPSDTLILKAIDCCLEIELNGECYYTLGQIHQYMNKLQEAEGAFQKALVLHKQAQSVIWQANDLYQLGCLFMHRDQLQEAEKVLQEALVLHKQAQYVLGQAYDLHQLGHLFMCRDQLQEAEKAFQEALVLHKQAQSVLGQANDLKELGCLFMHRGQLQEAEKAFQEALVLHKQAQYVLGQANDLNELGHLFMHRGQLQEAEKAFQEALVLHKQAQSVLGQAYDLYRLGCLFMHKDQLQEAEKAFQEALVLHKQAQDVGGQANDLNGLGYLFMRRDQLQEAEKALQEASVLHKQAQDVLGQAYDLHQLGHLFMCRDQLQKAEKAFQEALVLHKQAQDVLGQANDLNKLGHLFMHRDQLQEAEKALQEALVLHKQAQSVIWQAYDLNELGCLFMCRNQLQEAEKAFQKALVLHKQTQSVLGQAQDLHQLGCLFMCRDQWQEAEKAFQEALVLHKQAQDVSGQANDLHQLGHLFIHRDQLQEAEKAFQQALVLHKQAQDAQGQANGFIELGRLNINCNKAKDAIINLQDGLNIATRIEYPWGKYEAQNLLQTLQT